MSFEQYLQSLPKPFPVKGLPLDGGHPGIRKEIRDLASDATAFNLYLLGLWQIQKLPQDNRFSFFQLAGIHGLPYQAWPVDDQKIDDMNAQKDNPTGFCTHTSIIFLSWHRPYLALFEYIVQQSMLYVAKQFTAQEGQQAYLDAAQHFRIPYWDWARRDLPFFPQQAVNAENVAVIMPATMRKLYFPNSQQPTVTIHNPLYSYEFHDPMPSDDRDQYLINNKMTTQRWDMQQYDNQGNPLPNPNIPSPTPQQLGQFLETALTPFSQGIFQDGSGNDVKLERNLTERVMYLLQSYNVFKQVTSNKWDSQPGGHGDMFDNNGRVVKEGLGYGSIEDVHNSVHVICGGSGAPPGMPRGYQYSGQMANVPVSAFDPIFWLHHTNIDRLFAIWQGLHDDPSNASTYVTNQRSAVDRDDQGQIVGGGSWVTAPGAVEGISTPLAPFYKDSQNFWDSQGVRSTSVFGYAYPETQDWQFSGNKTAYRADIVQKLNTLYVRGSTANMIVKKRVTGSTEDEDRLKLRAQTLAAVKKAKEPANTVTLLQAMKGSTSAAPLASPTVQAAVAALPPPTASPVEVPNDRKLTDLAPDNKYLEWLVDIKAQKHALEGKYSVHVFLGPVEENNTALYVVSPNHVGTFSPLGQSDNTRCAKCKVDQDAGVEITGQIPLTIALVERYFAGVLPSLQPDDVVEYLKRDLHWEVLDGNGIRLAGNRDAVAGLLVGIISNEVTLADGVDGLHTYSPNITLYPDITTKVDGVTGRGEGTGVTRNVTNFG